jgi:hypothetical protein
MLYVITRLGDKALTSHVALPSDAADEFATGALRMLNNAGLSDVWTISAEPMHRCSDFTHAEDVCPEQRGYAAFVVWTGLSDYSFREWLGVGESSEQSSPGCETVTTERSP